MNNHLQLVTPFPLSHCQWLWCLLNEFPLQNFDDTSPRGPQAFAQEVHLRQNSGGETIWEVVQAGQPIGAIGYAPISDEIAALHGIAFARKHHGTGRPRIAMIMALNQIFAAGHSKVVAATFADNIAVYKFLRKLGFVEHHGGNHQTAREGMMIDVRIYSLHVDRFRTLHGPEVRRECPGEPQTVGGAD